MQLLTTARMKRRQKSHKLTLGSRQWTLWLTWAPQRCSQAELQTEKERERVNTHVYISSSEPAPPAPACDPSHTSRFNVTLRRTQWWRLLLTRWGTTLVFRIQLFWHTKHRAKNFLYLFFFFGWQQKWCKSIQNKKMQIRLQVFLKPR